MSSDVVEPSKYNVYVLRLEDSKYYVGMAPDVDARFEKHSAGHGAEWTKLYKPIEISQRRSFQTWTEAALNEDAATLWLMAKFNKGVVRGGRWLAEGHRTIYGLTEAVHVLRNPNISRTEQYQRILDLVVWTIPDSWYWDELLEKRPAVEKRLQRYPSYKSIPQWLNDERKSPR